MFQNVKNRWLLAVLISGLQLGASLLLVKWGFDWFEMRTVNAMSDESLSINAKLGAHLVNLFSSSTNEQSLPEKIENRAFDGKLVWVMNCRDGSLQVPPKNSNYPHEFLCGDRFVVSPNRDVEQNERVPLYRQFDNPSVNTVMGLASVGSDVLLVSAQRMSAYDAILVVGQSKQEVVSRLLGWFGPAKKIGFGLTLLLGFAAIVATTSILTQFDFQISGIYQHLSGCLQEQRSEIAKKQNGVIFGLAKLAESRDNDTGDHLDRIRKYVMILAEDLMESHPEIDRSFINNLALASSLHDIGKVGIPDAVLLKPGQLTAEERKIMEVHTRIGSECIEAIQNQMGTDAFLEMAKEIALSHHERWDGTGYPNGIKGDKIPLSARIVTVADVYDALTSRRPYKTPIEHFESCQIICDAAGTHFDPEIVETFKRQHRKFLDVLTASQSIACPDEELLPAIGRLQMALDQFNDRSESLSEMTV